MVTFIKICKFFTKLLVRLIFILQVLLCKNELIIMSSTDTTRG